MQTFQDLNLVVSFLDIDKHNTDKTKMIFVSFTTTTTTMMTSTSARADNVRSLLQIANHGLDDSLLLSGDLESVWRVAALEINMSQRSQRMDNIVLVAARTSSTSLQHDARVSTWQWTAKGIFRFSRITIALASYFTLHWLQCWGIVISHWKPKKNVTVYRTRRPCGYMTTYDHHHLK